MNYKLPRGDSPAFARCAPLRALTTGVRSLSWLRLFAAENADGLKQLAARKIASI